MRLWSIFCLALFMLRVGPAVEVAAIVSRHVDGDTIRVTFPSLGDETSVRLLWIDTPESRGNAHGKAMPEGRAASAYLAAILPVGSQVTLWGPGETLQADVYKRTLAVVLMPPVGVAEMKPRSSVQELMIANGHTVYWRKYGEAPEPWHARFLQAQQAAEEGGEGAWASAPKWMKDKANERTRPKGK